MPAPRWTPPASSDVEVAVFRRLIGDEGRAVLAGLPTYDGERALAVAEALRRAGVDPDLAAAALTQHRLRARAQGKFGPLADQLWFTATGLEQATRAVVADRHAQRFAGVGGRRVLDLCCGIGGDLLALAGLGLPEVVGVERDPMAAAVAVANVAVLGRPGVEVRCEDLRGTSLAGVDGVFVDPARRGPGGRALDPGAWSPPYDMVLGLAEQVPATGAKLAPGIAHHRLPAGAEAEWVSDGGDVVECALWCGPLSTGVARRATLLPSGATLTGDGSRTGEVGAVGRYLVEPDGAVIRAGLVAEAAELLDGRLLDATIAYVTTDRGDLAAATPFGTAYEVIDVMPFSIKGLRTLLRHRGVGRLTVKKRGTAVTPEELRRQLRLSGNAEATVVLTRIAGAQSILLVHPLPHLDGA